MLRIYHRENEKLVALDDNNSQQASAAVWFDLISPTPAEDKQVEQLLGIVVPSRDEMEEIELSARLYQESGAAFMTMTALANLDAEEPTKTPVTFILKGNSLVTVRYADPKPFLAYSTRAGRGHVQCSSGEMVMLGLLEAVTDRTADALERIGNDVDGLSREVFRNKAQNADKKTRDLSSVIGRLGQKAELLTMIQESLVSIGRLTAYHSALDSKQIGGGDEVRQLLKLVQRDTLALLDHAKSLTNRINFLLDATLGLINLQQNGIIKIFSVAAVVFLPPTLVASIYGMNFVYMPELNWILGYPWALGIMVASAVLPYLLFKRKGWL